MYMEEILAIVKMIIKIIELLETAFEIKHVDSL